MKRWYIPKGCDQQGRHRDGIWLPALDDHVDPTEPEPIDWWPLLGLVLVLGTFALACYGLGRLILWFEGIV